MASTGIGQAEMSVLRSMRKRINSISTSWYAFPLVQSPASVRDSVGAVILGAAVSSLKFTHLDNLFTLQPAQRYSLFSILELCIERDHCMMKL